MPERLAAIQTTDDGVTVDVANQRKAILEFLRAHPGEYFSVHAFSDGRVPGASRDSEERLFRRTTEEPFWWLMRWRPLPTVEVSGKTVTIDDINGRGVPDRNQAPEGFAFLTSGDVRRNHPDYFVGFPGAWSNLRVGYTKEEIERSNARAVAETDKMLEEVYQFLAAHRGTAYTQEEIQDALAPEKKRLWPFGKHEEPKTAGGTPRDTFTDLRDIAYWAYRHQNRVLYKDMVGILHGHEYEFGVPE